LVLDVDGLVLGVDAVADEAETAAASGVPGSPAAASPMRDRCLMSGVVSIVTAVVLVETDLAALRVAFPALEGFSVGDFSVFDEVAEIMEGVAPARGRILTPSGCPSAPTATLGLARPVSGLGTC
jgi:hypothetical protein